MTPEAFAAKINAWARGQRARLDLRPALTQLTGRFHAGAIIAQADETATAAAMWETDPTAESVPSCVR